MLILSTWHWSIVYSVFVCGAAVALHSQFGLAPARLEFGACWRCHGSAEAGGVQPKKFDKCKHRIQLGMAAVESNQTCVSHMACVLHVCIELV